MSAAIATPTVGPHRVPPLPVELHRQTLTRLWELQDANVAYCCWGGYDDPDECEGCPAQEPARAAFDAIQAAIEAHPSWKRWQRRWGIRS